MPDSYSNPAAELPTLAFLSEDAQQQLAHLVTHNYQRWKQSRARLECKWRECWEAYLCDVKPLEAQPDDTVADRSRIARPVLYEAVEAIHASLLNALFPANERFFTVIGRTESDHQQSRQIEEFIRNKLEEASFIEKYALFLKQAVITGNTVAAVPWRTMRQTRRVEKPVTLFGITVGYQKVTQDTVIYNGPDFEVLDIFDFLVDPDATDFEQATVIRKVERTVSELQANPSYSNLQALQPKNSGMDLDESNKLSRRRSFGLDEPMSSEPTDGKIKLLECWGDFTIGDTRYANYVCVVANDSTVIRFEPNPYDCGMKPFIFTNFIPVPNEIYGIGAIEKSLGLQHAINTLTNQKLDVINLSINSPFTYLINDDVFDPEKLVTRPGALIPVKNHDTLRPIQYLNNFTVAFTEIADLKAEAQEATGAFKYFSNGDNSQPRSATEINALINSGSQKFSSFLAHLEHTSLEPFLKIVFENARQFVYEPESLCVGNQNGTLQFQTILPDLLKTTQCQFRIDGSKGLLLREQELRAITTFLQLVNDNPQLQHQVNITALYKKIYRRLGFTDEMEIFQENQPNRDNTQPAAYVAGGQINEP